jgi:dTDP-4-amino-4,6-dideoxygalactose transaminase
VRDDVDAAIARVLDGSRFVLGAEVEAFEDAFARYCGAEHAVGVASGTDALALALEAVGVGPGDEVVTAANTCVPTVAAIECAGATPVLADVDASSFTLDPKRVADVLTPRTRALVPVHLYGRCADMEPILDFAREHGLEIVEDAAQAHGAEYGGRRAGTLGRAAAFSFYPTKNLGAFGDGGAVVTTDRDVAAQVRLLRMYGEDRRYHSVRSGRNSRLDELQAAILGAQLPHLDAWTARRREIAARYDDALAGSAVQGPGAADGHAYHLYVVRSRERDRLRELLEAAGVGTLVHYPVPVHLQPAYRGLAPEGSLPVSETLSQEVLSLPLYPELEDAEVDAVVAAVREASARLA